MPSRILGGSRALRSLNCSKMGTSGVSAPINSQAVEGHRMTSPLVELYPEQSWILNRVEVSDSCWKWLGCLDARGYGIVRRNNKALKVHRVVYEIVVGKIPEGLVIDHVCRNRACCNPHHLEPVTNQENIIRGFKARPMRTHCKQGHPLDNANTYWHKGRWNCRACNLIYTHRRRGLPDLHNAGGKPVPSK